MNSQTARYVQSIVLGFTFVAGCGATLFLLLLTSPYAENLVFHTILPTDQAAAIERKLVTSSIRQYLSGSGELAPSLFTDRERAHMRDVKELIEELRWLTLFSWLVFALALLRFCADRVSIAPILRLATAYTAASIFVVSLIVIFFFEHIFLLFHEVSFSNDLWLLDPAQHALIRAYPQEFFVRFTTLYLIALMIFFGTVSRAIPKK